MFDADIEAALAALPPDFRAAVVLCDVEGLTYEEIAGVLDLKMGTVRSRIHRGRAMLRTALAHRAPKDGRVRYAGPPSRAAADDDPGPERSHRRPRRARSSTASSPRPRRSAPGRTSWAAPAAAGWSSARAGSRPGSARCPTPRPGAAPDCSARCTTWTPGPPSTRSSAAVARARTAIAAVGAGSVGAAVLGLVAFTGPPAGLGERPPTRQAPASVTARPRGSGCLAGSGDRRLAPSRKIGPVSDHEQDPWSAPDQRSEPTQPLSSGHAWASPSAPVPDPQAPPAGSMPATVHPQAPPQQGPPQEQPPAYGGGYGGYGPQSHPHSHPQAYPQHTIPLPTSPRPPRGRLSGWVWPMIAVLSLLLGIGGGVLGALLVTGNGGDGSGGVLRVERRTAAPLPADNKSIAAVADQVLPSTVQIIAEFDGDPQGATGSGFVLDKQGHVITNNHVVAEAAKDDGHIEIIDHNGKHSKATVVGRSLVYDIAVLKSEGAEGHDPGEAGLGGPDARRRDRGRDRLAARPEQHGHLRHHQRARPAGDHRRVRGRHVVHQRGADRRGDQPRQLRRSAGQPAGPGRRRELRDRLGRVASARTRAATSASASRSRSSRSWSPPTRSCKTGKAEYPIIGANVQSSRDVDGAEITGVTNGQPADDAGLRTGDLVVAVDGKTDHQQHRPGGRDPQPRQGRPPQADRQAGLGHPAADADPGRPLGLKPTPDALRSPRRRTAAPRPRAAAAGQDEARGARRPPRRSPPSPP